MTESVPHFKTYTSAMVVAASLIVPVAPGTSAGNSASGQFLRETNLRAIVRASRSTSEKQIFAGFEQFHSTQMDTYRLSERGGEMIQSVNHTDSSVLLHEHEENKLRKSVSYAVLAVMLFGILSVIGVIHWAFWFPPLAAALGVALSNGMQLNRIEELRKGSYVHGIQSR